MAERQAIYKTLRQRRGETILAAVLGIFVALVARAFAPFSVVTAPLLFLAVVLLVVFAHTKLRERRGAPQLPASQINLQTMHEIAARPAWLTILEWTAGFGFLLPCLFMLELAGAAFSKDMFTIYALAPVAGMVVGIRRVRAAKAVAQGDTGRWYLPFYYVLVLLGVCAGLLWALRLQGSSQETRVAALVCGMLAAIVLVPPRSILEQDEGGPSFLDAVRWGVVWWGVPLMIFIAGLAAAMNPGVLHLPALVKLATALVVIGIGLIGGGAFGVLVWLYIRALLAKPPREPSPWPSHDDRYRQQAPYGQDQWRH